MTVKTPFPGILMLFIEFTDTFYSFYAITINPSAANLVEISDIRRISM